MQHNGLLGEELAAAAAAALNCSALFNNCVHACACALQGPRDGARSGEEVAAAAAEQQQQQQPKEEGSAEEAIEDAERHLTKGQRQQRFRRRQAELRRQGYIIVRAQRWGGGIK